MFDQRQVDPNAFDMLPVDPPVPGWFDVERWIEAGALVRADTLEELAEQIGVPAGALSKSVEQFNEFAVTGVDEQFHRGETPWDRVTALLFGAHEDGPNRCLGVIDQGPFYAVQVVVTDLGTKGGLVTDADARVLRPDGSVIEGLYASGNTMAPAPRPHLSRRRRSDRLGDGLLLPRCPRHGRRRHGWPRHDGAARDHGSVHCFPPSTRRRPVLEMTMTSTLDSATTDSGAHPVTVRSRAPRPLWTDDDPPADVVPERYRLGEAFVPKGRYLDAEFQQLEVDRLFTKTWLMACRLEDLPGVGSYVRVPDRRRTRSSSSANRPTRSAATSTPAVTAAPASPPDAAASAR